MLWISIATCDPRYFLFAVWLAKALPGLRCTLLPDSVNYFNPWGKSRHGGKIRSFGPTGEANRRVAVAGLRQPGNCFTAQDGPTHRQSAFQSFFSAVWDA